MVTMNHPDELLLVLNRIGNYAREHRLKPQDVQRIFEAGIAARDMLIDKQIEARGAVPA